MKFRLLIIIFSIIVLGLGCTNKETKEILQTNKPLAKELVQNQVLEQEVYDISLESFSKEKFIGENFNIGNILADNNLYTRYYITYTSNGLTISGIMNKPKGKGPFPLLILNHGYIDPVIYTNGRGLKREQDYLAKQGYIVIHPDYRNHANSSKDPNVDVGFRLAYATDVVNAVHAIKSADLPYVDNDNIGMLGHSMGGGIALQIMTTLPELVDAYVLFAPVSADARHNFDKWIRNRRVVATTILEMYGEIDTNPSFWDGISPNKYFDNISKPIMYHHGTLDESVPIAWSENAVKEMQNAGINVKYHVYEGEKHEFINQWPLVLQRTTEFFDEYLK